MPWETSPRAPSTDRAPLRRLDRLVAGLRAGRGGAVAVTGEPGAGKTALLARLVTRAPGVTVLATGGVPGEAALPYAALGDLLRPLRHRWRSLPGPQARALGAALALEEAGSDGFRTYAICLATLHVLSAAGPVLVVVDDVELIDRPSAAALFFTARRIRRAPVALVLAARRPPDAPAIETLWLPSAGRHAQPCGEHPAAAGTEGSSAAETPPGVVEPTAGGLRRRDVLGGLTRREVDVVRAVAGGLSNPEAATVLRLSRKTVETHLSSAYRKLGVRTRTQLVRYLVEAGISG